VDAGIDNTAVLDGFTISGGNADGLGFGGGMLIDGGSPTLSNDIFDSNSAGYGGAYITMVARPF